MKGLMPYRPSETTIPIQVTGYTLTISAMSGGTTDPAPGAYDYAEGEVVPVTAISEIGYVLDRWELDGLDVGKELTINVTMDADHGLHAAFSLGGTGGVEVTVINKETDQPIENAFVRLIKDHVVVDEVYTDGNGKALFSVITEGTYTLYVQAEGYQILEEEIEVTAGIINYFEASLTPVLSLWERIKQWWNALPWWKKLIIVSSGTAAVGTSIIIAKR